MTGFKSLLFYNWRLSSCAVEKSTTEVDFIFMSRNQFFLFCVVLGVVLGVVLVSKWNKK